MSELIHADIFFFITAVAVVVLSLIAGVALVYAVFIMRDVRAIVARMRRASESLESDFNALRHNVAEEGVKARAFVNIVLGFLARKVGGGAKAKKHRTAAKQSAKPDDSTEE